MDETSLFWFNQPADLPKLCCGLKRSSVNRVVRAAICFSIKVQQKKQFRIATLVFKTGPN